MTSGSRPPDPWKDLPPASRWAPRTAWWVAAVFAAVLAGALVHGLVRPTEAPTRRTVRISLVPPPAPKPPPPTPERATPREEMKIAAPTPKPEPRYEAPPAPERPPAPAVGATGPRGDDAFGLAPGRNSGEVQISGSGGSSGLPTAPLAALQEHLRQALARNDRIRDRRYRVIVLIRIAAEGTVRSAETAEGSGDAAFDELLMESLRRIDGIPGANELTSGPIRVRLVSLGGGA